MYYKKGHLHVKHEKMEKKWSENGIYCGNTICIVEYVEDRKRKNTNGVHIKVLFFNTSYL